MGNKGKQDIARATFIQKQEDNIAIHIFTVSAGMVGVCITVIGIVNVISTTQKTATLVDDITAYDAIFFLLSCVISYFAIKKESKNIRFLLEKTADLLFLVGLFVMVAICFLIVYKVA